MAVVDTVMNALTSCRTGYMGKSYIKRVAGFVRNRMRYKRVAGFVRNRMRYRRLGVRLGFNKPSYTSR